MNNFKTSIIAHRGASYEAPENTLSAVNLAWKLNADAVEVDVHLSKDGETVVFHDYDLKRICGIDKKISELSIDEIKQFDAGKWKGDQWIGEKIPLLEEILNTVPENKKIIVEIKCGVEIIDRLKNVVEKSKLRSDQIEIEFIGFDLELMSQVKKEFPNNRTLGLWELKEDREHSIFYPSVDEIIAKSKELGFDGIDVNACCALTEKFIKWVKDAGLLFYVYTVDDFMIAKYFIDQQIEGITTNRPDFLLQFPF